MCGIIGFLDIQGDPRSYRDEALNLSRLLRHRGPDWSGVWSGEKAVLAHERLAIVDLMSGAQPLIAPESGAVLAVNGEIYNHRDLRSALRSPYPFSTESDCEVILPLWMQEGPAFLDRLRGMFAFIIVEPKTGRWMIARDHMGIIPLYVGHTVDGTMVVSSEMKALVGICTSVQEFPPGSYQTDKDAAPVSYYSRSWFDYDAVEDRPADPAALREALSESVRSHLMSDVPYGVLLSGGLDSSVVSALAASMADKRIESGDSERAWWPRLHSFSIGLPGSPDLAAAELAAKALGTVHHSFTYSIQEGLDALRDVIWHTETFDVTTIRASTPMYLMARRIKAMGVKMVLSGEGADEIFGGYLYFHKAPNPRAFHEETVNKLKTLHLFDCNRANKSMAAWGVEARVPFLDKVFMDAAMNIHPKHKMCTGGKIEKNILREAFEGWLPKEVLWRQKEQFSDGVGYGWIDTLKAKAEEKVTDRELRDAHLRFPIGTPYTKEAFVYRAIFDELFPLPSAAACIPTGPSVACSTPAAIEWDASFKANADPSGRAVLGVHDSAI